MNLYNNYTYLYPPRPEVKINPRIINTYDKGQFLAQPKYNGSCAVLFINGDTGFYKIMNRHNEPFSKDKIKMEEMDFGAAYRGTGWLVLCGELLNKAKTGEDGKLFNQKFIIWDILVYNSEYLLGTTVIERLELLEKLYPSQGNENAHLLNIGIKGVFKAPVYDKDFAALYQDLVKTDMYEGVVMKRKDAQLQLGYNSANNTSWQVKVRKPTKNYKF